MAAASVLRRGSMALVLIDMQDRLADVMPHRDTVVATSVLLARAARAMGVPMLVTRQYPNGLGDTVAELREVVADVVPVDKVAFSCSADEGFRSRLAALGKSQIVLAGMETHICITQTALGLLAAGHEVHVVADATCSRRDGDHAVALDRLRSAGVVVTAAESVIYEALGAAGTEEFKVVLAAVKAHTLGK